MAEIRETVSQTKPNWLIFSDAQAFLFCSWILPSANKVPYLHSKPERLLGYPFGIAIRRRIKRWSLQRPRCVPRAHGVGLAQKANATVSFATGRDDRRRVVRRTVVDHDDVEILVSPPANVAVLLGYFMLDSRLHMTRHRYRIYGLVIDSGLQFTSIEEAGERAAVVAPAVSIVLKEAAFFRAKLGAVPVASDGWIDHAVLADGSFYLKAGDVFEAVVSSDGRRADCMALGDTDLASFEANLLNFVLSAALTLQGEEPMHSTVVDVGGRAVGLLGPSGAGKSTLAAALIRSGGSLVTDDMLRITFTDDKAVAHAGPHRLKLFDEPARLLLP